MDSHGWSGASRAFGSAWAEAPELVHAFAGLSTALGALGCARCGVRRGMNKHRVAGSGGGCCERAPARSRKQPSPAERPPTRFPHGAWRLAASVGWYECRALQRLLLARRAEPGTTTQRAIERATPAAVCRRACAHTRTRSSTPADMSIALGCAAGRRGSNRRRSSARRRPGTSIPAVGPASPRAPGRVPCARSTCARHRHCRRSSRPAAA